MIRVLGAFAVVLVASGLAAWGAEALARLGARQRWVLAVAGGGLLAAAVLLRPLEWWLASVAVVVGAISIGSLIGRGLRGAPALLAFCLAASAVDFASFAGGLTRRLIDDYRAGVSDLLPALAVSMPSEGGSVAVLGIGDLIVLAAICVALRRMDASWALALGVPLGGLLAALGFALLAGPVPGIPWMALPTFAVVLRRLRRSR